MKRRIMLGFSTLAMVALVLSGCIVGTLITSPSLPVSSVGNKKAVYAISYNSLLDPDALSNMEYDIKYIKSLGLRFLLPSDLNTSDSGGMLLIIEHRGGESVSAIISMLEKNNACAVFAVDKGCSDDDLKLINDAAKSHKAELAYVFETCSSEPVDMITAFTEARMECFSIYGVESKIYIHRCSEPLCARASINEKRYPTDMFIFGYGNGMNLIELPCKGIVGLNRILRLLDWSIEDYFSSIAG